MQEKNSEMCLFSARLTELMHKKGFNTVSLAEITGVSQSGISKYKRAASMPKVSELSKLAKILGVSMGYLWGDEDDLVNSEWEERALVAEEELSQLKKAIQILTSTVSTHEKTPRG